MERLTIGFAGLGRMGIRVAARLAEHHQLIVFNRTRATAEDFAARTKARIASIPAELAEAEAVVIMVAGDDAVRSVLNGDNGVLNQLREGQLIVLLATVSPILAEQLADRVRDAGGRFVAAPVAGAPPQAESGQLTVIAGGSEHEIAAALPILEPISARIVRLAGPREAATLKLAFNLIIHDLNVALAEGLSLAERAGVDRPTTYDLLATGPLACPFVLNKRRFFENPTLEQTGGATVCLAEDDLRMAIEFADGLGLQLPITVASRDQLKRAADAGLSDRDESAVMIAVSDSQGREVP